MWWTSLGIGFRDARHLLPIMPLACLAVAIVWLLDLNPIGNVASALRRGVCGLGWRFDRLPAASPRLLDWRLISFGGIAGIIGLTMVWLPAVPGSSVARLIEDWSRPSAFQHEVPAVLAADSSALGWQPRVSEAWWGFLLWTIPADTHSLVKTILPTSPLQTTAPYQAYEQWLWSARLNANQRAWDDRLPLSLPPEAELMYYKPDLLSAAVVRRLASNGVAPIAQVTASSVAADSGPMHFAPEQLLDSDALTGWKSASSPIDGAATEQLQLDLAPQIVDRTFEVEQFTGVSPEEFQPTAAPGTWLTSRWQQ